MTLWKRLKINMLYFTYIQILLNGHLVCPMCISDSSWKVEDIRHMVCVYVTVYACVHSREREKGRMCVHTMGIGKQAFSEQCSPAPSIHLIYKKIQIIECTWLVERPVVVKWQNGLRSEDSQAKELYNPAAWYFLSLDMVFTNWNRTAYLLYFSISWAVLMAQAVAQRSSPPGAVGHSLQNIPPCAKVVNSIMILIVVIYSWV